MRTIRTVAEIRAYTARARSQGKSIGLVATMGAFHGGHLSLIRAARESCDEVFVWLFVNPAQFDEQEDLAAYPRDEAADAAQAAELGVDVLFAPPVEEVYPPGFATIVTVKSLGDTLEGAQRPGHFAGVATVVTKMLNMVGPDVAFFGAKDAQQVALVKRLVADLDIPVRIEVLPIVRDQDGLALSSRNVRLGPQQRLRALGLSRGLREAEAAVRAGETDPQRVEAAARGQMAGVEVEYVAVVDPDTFEPLAAVNGRALIAVAGRVGDIRLIDNTLITTRDSS